ncbi:unnamed protein product [Cylindrotheca closterium]|uniref:Uncharacterized protein n=1 Tax=Cylindrotheca closterium TaxID=2856 RepID=A0AAD2G9L0_9STRA|nr:unnamed protein product [Cylindrotheca closterium]
MAKSSPRSAAPSPTSTMEPLEETTRYNLTAEGNFDPVIQHINTSAGIRPIGPPSKSKIPHAAKRVVVPSPLQIGRTSTIPGLMEFLTKNVGFFKTPPNAFSDYLTSMDIESIRDLAEAVEDDDVMAGSMRMVLRNSRKARSSKPFLQSRL